MWTTQGDKKIKNKENHTRDGVEKKIKKASRPQRRKEMKKTKKTTTVDEKQKIVDDFIKRVNPYKKPETIAFDLRGYAAYIEEHGEATPEIMESFRK